jgi:hypothetical protein
MKAESKEVEAVSVFRSADTTALCYLGRVAGVVGESEYILIITTVSLRCS